MSRFGLGFLRELGIAVEAKGYCTSAALRRCRRCTRLQRAHGADVVLLNRGKCAARFPWLSMEGVELGVARTSRRRLVRRPGAARGGAAAGAGAGRAADRAARRAGSNATRTAGSARCVLADGSRLACGHVVLSRGPLVARAGGAGGHRAAGRSPPPHGVRAVLPGPLAGLPAGDRSERILVPARGPLPHRRHHAESARPRRPAARAGPREFDEALWPLARRVPALARAARRARLGRLLRDEPLRPQRDRRRASRLRRTCTSPPASPGTACSRRRRPAAASPN